jgi:hypothetical protein
MLFLHFLRQRSAFIEIRRQFHRPAQRIRDRRFARLLSCQLRAITRNWWATTSGIVV